MTDHEEARAALEAAKASLERHNRHEWAPALHRLKQSSLEGRGDLFYAVQHLEQSLGSLRDGEQRLKDARSFRDQTRQIVERQRGELVVEMERWLAFEALRGEGK